MSSNPAAAEAPAFDFMNPESKKDPFPLLHRLREEDPVHFVGGPYEGVLRNDSRGSTTL